MLAMQTAMLSVRPVEVDGGHLAPSSLLFCNICVNWGTFLDYRVPEQSQWLPIEYV